jgi:hypothetical protein
MRECVRIYNLDTNIIFRTWQCLSKVASWKRGKTKLLCYKPFNTTYKDEYDIWWVVWIGK